MQPGKEKSGAANWHVAGTPEEESGHWDEKPDEVVVKDVHPRSLPK